MAPKVPPAGYIFVGNSDNGWDASKELRPGVEDSWERVSANQVEIGLPVWILQCGTETRYGRGFYGSARTIAPKSPRPDVAWLRYELRFEEPILLSSVNAYSGALQTVDWQDNRLPNLFGIRAGGNHYPAPCGFVGTLFPVGGQDALRVRQLFPKLPDLAVTAP